MSRYNTFLTVFIISVAAFIFFFAFYLNGIFTFIFHAHEHIRHTPVSVVTTIFSPGMILSGMILVASSLTYRILGIVHVARNNTITDGEKALWIIGFVMMGFITAIVFLVLSKSKKIME